ncbi:hypothetical protein ARMGADRAFT_52960 [Armillaria gallica]|uniref:Uncharacterized protein n=1 Tax=Armillaria gallica TaxID=47427 RepID=A0A2H3EEG5_ARMGA|nr:hypothetical protein ARMGADRAFT_52960 [Armillaria gallica]
MSLIVRRYDKDRSSKCYTMSMTTRTSPASRKGKSSPSDKHVFVEDGSLIWTWIARQQGKEIELNNQTVDKRELMAAGLNLSSANKRKLGRSTLGKPKDGQTEAIQSHRAVGTVASHGEISKRREREIQIQMEKEQVHLALEKQ